RITSTASHRRDCAPPATLAERLGARLVGELGRIFGDLHQNWLPLAPRLHAVLQRHCVPNPDHVVARTRDDAAGMAMIAITTSNSIRVKPDSWPYSREPGIRSGIRDFTVEYQAMSSEQQSRMTFSTTGRGAVDTETVRRAAKVSNTPFQWLDDLLTAVERMSQ